MIPEQIYKRIGNLPYMKLSEAHIFYDFILANELKHGLELGFFHGVSSCYIAGALEETQGGRLTTIDMLNARDRQPNIEALLAELQLSDIVDIYYEPSSFNWRMMRFLEQGMREAFDFCYLDGAHTWDNTGFAFCLVEHLLAPGGWVIFDDLYSSLARSPSRDKKWVQRLPLEEQTEQQVLRVFELLVEPNPQFTNFRRVGGRFGFAQKVISDKTVMPLPNALAVERALERAESDPEFREKLLVASDEVKEFFFALGVLCAELPVFEEGNSFGPKPAWRREDGVFVVPIEKPVLDKTEAREPALG